MTAMLAIFVAVSLPLAGMMMAILLGLIVQGWGR